MAHNDESFDDLITVVFQKRLRPIVLSLYCREFPGCEITDLRANGKNTHVLDQAFGIDLLIRLPGGQTLSFQEKYREYDAWRKYKDFTQEYMNAAGTQYESPGEWFKLSADIYFYGWANKKCTALIAWFMMEIPRYKMLVEMGGGLPSFSGKGPIPNKKHGRASFYSIDVQKLRPAIFKSSHPEWIGNDFMNQSPLVSQMEMAGF